MTKHRQPEATVFPLHFEDRSGVESMDDLRERPSCTSSAGSRRTCRACGRGRSSRPKIWFDERGDFSALIEHMNRDVAAHGIPVEVKSGGIWAARDHIDLTA